MSEDGAISARPWRTYFANPRENEGLNDAME